MTISKISYRAKTNNGKNIFFRYPIIDDLQILTNYINKLSAEKTFIIFQGQKISLTDEKKYLQSALKKIKNKEAIHLLAFINSDLVGYADLQLRELSQDYIGNFGITIAKNYRRQGIGRILFNLVLKESQKRISKLKIVTLSVLTSNKLAHDWYKRNKFIEYGRLPEGIKRKNKFEEVIFMYKKIK